MANDAELDRLKSEQDRAYSRQKEMFSEMKRLGDEAHGLYEATQITWRRRQSAKDEMNSEFERMQSERSSNEAVWDEYKRIRDTNNSRIESLKSLADGAYRSMADCFERASDAFRNGDKSAAPGYSAQGRQYQSRLHELNGEIRRLGAEVKSARAHAEARSRNSNSDLFSSAKARFESAKREHQTAQTVFKAAKLRADTAKKSFEEARAENKRARDAFQKRLTQVKAENQKRHDSDRDLMNRAGIPHYYREHCKVRREPDGTVNFYFGGLGDSDGFGHAHVSMDSRGHITYNRSAFDAHGSQNFSDYQERQKEHTAQRQRRSRWDSEVMHGTLADTGEEVTFKTTKNQSDVLIARRHIPDIQGQDDHVHAWNQREGEPDHHEMRRTPPLFTAEE